MQFAADAFRAATACGCQHFGFDGYSHVTARAGATVYLKQMAIAPSTAFSTNKPTASGRHPAGNGAYLTVSQATCNHHEMHLSEAHTPHISRLEYTAATRTTVRMTKQAFIQATRHLQKLQQQQLADKLRLRTRPPTTSPRTVAPSAPQTGLFPQYGPSGLRFRRLSNKR